MLLSTVGMGWNIIAVSYYIVILCDPAEAPVPSCTWYWRPTNTINDQFSSPRAEIILWQNDSLTCLPIQYQREFLFPVSPANQSMLRTSIQSFLLLWPYVVVVGRCGISLDPWMLPVGDDIYQNRVQQPLLIINSEKFQWASNILKMNKLISNDTNKKMITIKWVVQNPSFLWLKMNLYSC